jgi:hypothetical protein
MKVTLKKCHTLRVYSLEEKRGRFYFGGRGRLSIRVFSLREKKKI